METYALSSFIFNMVYTAIAFAAVIFGLRTFDKFTKRPFGKSYDRMAESGMALAIYYGARFVGITFLMAAILG